MSSIGKVEQIPLPHILSATENFAKKNFIAGGGFGRVYKGHSEEYGTIAVKRLDHGISGQGEHEFMREIELLSSYKHINLVSLVGFCDQDEEKILVYKPESNGSLDKHLQSKDLNWIQRLRICLDAAKGLKYLHHDVGHQRRVVHRDVKSSNILLDENMKAKISDFGLSKISPTNVSCTFLISNACGTMGYIDPEYYIYGVLTQKSDIYSFGVVLFEVLCGRPARVMKYQDKRQFLCILAQNHFDNNTLYEIIDTNLRDQMDPDSLKTFSTIAYDCLTKCRKDRPSMTLIVEKLEKALDEQLAASSGLKHGAALQQGLSTSMDYMTQSGVIPSSPSSSHSTRPSSSQLLKYDVFLSFRGDDTRYTFVNHLYFALVRQGVYTFKDDKTLPRGETIGPSLLKAIEESQIAVIIFSENYAESSWCLQELAHIMKCKDERGLVVMPILHHVDPLDVRNHHGEFGVRGHKSNINTIESWRKALVDATNLRCWPTNGSEKRFIKDIVDTILQRLVPSLLASSDDPGLFGIKTRMQEIRSQLKVGFDGVRMVGILGTWGSGKSTLASAIYDEINHKFEGCCFVKNVGGESRMHGMKTLQEQILSNVLNLREPVVLGSIGEGISMMESRLCETRVLIVLDDVYHLDHLKMLAGSKDWFGSGSRIIITTRNKNLLKAHNINIIYNVRLLNQEEAIELFCWHAFGVRRPAEGYKQFSVNMVSKFGGHPSALKRFGSILRGKDKSELFRTSVRLKDITVDEILELFKTDDDGVEIYIDSWFGF